MPLLLDELLATLDDFAPFRDISKNIDAARIDSFIREAQVRELRSFLGDNLYLKLLVDFTPPETFGEKRFEDLFLGAEYDSGGGVSVRFNGLKSALIMWAYKRLLEHQQVSLTRYGVKSMQTDFSEDTLAAKIRTEKIDSDSFAKVYEADAVKFLRAKRSDYPEWKPTETKLDKTGFQFKKL